MLCRELEEAGAVVSGVTLLLDGREGLSPEVTLVQTAEGRECTEHTKVEGQKSLDRGNTV